MTTIPEAPPNRGTLFETPSDIRFVDVTRSESFSDSTTVTDNRIETGSKTSDHAHDEPVEYSIRAFVTDTPQGQPGSPGRSQRIYEGFLRLRETKELATITAGARVLENMLLVSVELTEDAPGMAALEFNMRWREIRMVTGQRVFIPPEQIEDEDDRDRATDNTEAGPQEAAPASEGEAKAAAAAIERTQGSLAYERLLSDETRSQGAGNVGFSDIFSDLTGGLL